MIQVAALVRAVGAVSVMIAGASAARRQRRTHRPADLGVAQREDDLRRPTGIDLRGSRHRHVDLSLVDDLRDADLRRSLHRRSSLDGRDLSGSSLVHASLDASTLRDAHLDRADLSWCSMRDCDLRGATFSGAILVEADLSGAQLDGADLSDAHNLVSATWRGATADRTTRWPAGFSPATAGVRTRSRTDEAPW